MTNTTPNLTRHMDEPVLTAFGIGTHYRIWLGEIGVRPGRMTYMVTCASGPVNVALACTVDASAASWASAAGFVVDAIAQEILDNT